MNKYCVDGYILQFYDDQDFYIVGKDGNWLLSHVNDIEFPLHGDMEEWYHSYVVNEIEKMNSKKTFFRIYFKINEKIPEKTILEFGKGKGNYNKMFMEKMIIDKMIPIYK